MATGFGAHQQKAITHSKTPFDPDDAYQLINSFSHIDLTKDFFLEDLQVFSSTIASVPLIALHKYLGGFRTIVVGGV